MPRLLRFGLLVLTFVLSGTAAQAQISWTFNYADVTNASGFGFDDATSGATRRNTVTAVTNYLNTVLDGRGAIDFDWDPSVNAPGSGTLASAGTFYSIPSGATLLVGSVYRQGAGNLTTGTPGFGEVNFGRSWFATGLSGTGTPGGSEFDLFTVLLHEITHSMHFASVFNSDGTSQFGAGTYVRGDGFLYRGATGGTKQLNTAGTTYTGTSGDLTSNDIYWDGTYAKATNGGNRVKIYAPGTFSSGSSISHIDEATFTTSVMTPSVGTGPSQVMRNYSGIEIGMLLDLGWNQFQWNNTTGSWSDGAASLSGTKWLNSAIQNTDKSIRAPVGSITHNIVLTFGGSGGTAYTATNDLPASPFMVNRIVLASTATVENTITGNPLQMSFDNGYTATPQIEQTNTGAFIIANNIAIPNGLDLAGTGTGAVTLSGVLSGAGAVTKSGTFTSALSGANTYSGNTTINAGTLKLAASGSFASSPQITVNSSGTLNVTTGSGNLTGGTNFDSSTFATSRFALASGQSLRGAGNVTGSVGVRDGSRISPGAGSSSAGNLTVTGDVAFQSSSAIYEVNLNGTTAGTNYDRLTVIGEVNLNNAALTATISGYTPAAADKLFIISNDGTDAVIGTFNGLANGASLTISGTPAFIYYSGDLSANTLTGGNDVVISFTPVPEPATVLAIGVLGLGVLGGVRRLRRTPVAA